MAKCQVETCPLPHNEGSPWCDKHLDEAMDQLLRACIEARTGKPYTGKTMVSHEAFNDLR